MKGNESDARQSTADSLVETISSVRRIKKEKSRAHFTC